jgi:hypothetical protein
VPTLGALAQGVVADQTRPRLSGGNFNACAGALHACDDDDERMLFTNVGDGVNANFKSNLEQMQTEGRGEKKHPTPHTPLIFFF